MDTASGNNCLTTVTDEAFLPGTLVLLSSFLHHNPWFDGDIVIIHNGLPESARAPIARFPNVRFQPVSEALKVRLAALAAGRPQIAGKLPRLYSIEAFTLSGYDWVLMLDSDVLCTGNVAALAAIDGAVLGIPDQSYFRDHVRHLRTYVPQHKSLGTPQQVYPMTFNTGVVLFRPPAIEPDVYAALSERIHPDTWSMVRTGHTDSVVLNAHFRGRWTAVPETFNYVISRDAARYTRPRAALGDALLLHYIGRPKPWDPAAATAAAAMDAERRRAFALWDEASRDQRSLK